MKPSLAESYVSATINELPAELHNEVRLELQASIADALEARMAQGEDRDAAERAVLTELGDPAVLAASYIDRPLHLIGPRYYLAWARLLKQLLIIIPPIVFVVVALAQVLASGDIGTVMAESITVTITTALHVCFWVTLVFAIMERTGVDTGLTWDVDQLPEPREDQPGRADMIASLVFLGLVLVAVGWDQLSGFIRFAGDSIPMLNPELWPWTMGIFLGLIVLEIIFAIMLYIRRGWNVTMAVVNTLLSVAMFSFFIILLLRGELFSADFLNLAVENGVGDDSLYTLAVVFGFGVGVIAIWDILDGWIKTYRARSAGSQQQPATQH